MDDPKIMALPCGHDSTRCNVNLKLQSSLLWLAGWSAGWLVSCLGLKHKNSTISKSRKIKRSLKIGWPEWGEDGAKASSIRWTSSRKVKHSFMRSTFVFFVVKANFPLQQLCEFSTEILTFKPRIRNTKNWVSGTVIRQRHWKRWLKGLKYTCVPNVGRIYFISLNTIFNDLYESSF